MYILYECILIIHLIVHLVNHLIIHLSIHLSTLTINSTKEMQHAAE